MADNHCFDQTCQLKKQTNKPQRFNFNLHQWIQTALCCMSNSSSKREEIRLLCSTHWAYFIALDSIYRKETLTSTPLRTENTTLFFLMDVELSERLSFQNNNKIPQDFITDEKAFSQPAWEIFPCLLANRHCSCPILVVFKSASVKQHEARDMRDSPICWKLNLLPTQATLQYAEKLSTEK